MVRQILLAGMAVILPVAVQARGHAGASGGGHSVAAAPSAHVGAPAVSGARSGSRIVVPRAQVPIGTRPGTKITGTRRQNVTTARSRRPPNCNTAPGLGFDEAHHIAVCGAESNGFRSAGFTNGYYFPFYEGGFYMPGASGNTDENTVADANPQNAPEEDSGDYGRRYRPQPEVQANYAGPDDNSGYIFVRRDGTVFFAVAYSWEDGALRYVTSEGLRRTIAEDALDLNATKQFNEQRGFNFRLPA